MSDAPDALVLVYNADEGWAAALFDAAHKLVSPATYGCSLCGITYGAVAMRGAWKDWLARQDVVAEFHHRQDFARAFPAFACHPLPAIFRRDGAALRLLLGDADIAACGDVAGLIAALERVLAD